MMQKILRKSTRMKIICLVFLSFFITSCSGVAPKKIQPADSSSFNSAKARNGKIPLDILLDISDIKITGDASSYSEYTLSVVPDMIRDSLAKSFKSVTIAGYWEVKKNTSKPVIRIDRISISGYQVASVTVKNKTKGPELKLESKERREGKGCRSGGPRYH